MIWPMNSYFNRFSVRSNFKNYTTEIYRMEVVMMIDKKRLMALLHFWNVRKRGSGEVLGPTSEENFLARGEREILKMLRKQPRVLGWGVVSQCETSTPRTCLPTDAICTINVKKKNIILIQKIISLNESIERNKKNSDQWSPYVKLLVTAMCTVAWLNSVMG